MSSISKVNVDKGKYVFELHWRNKTNHFLLVSNREAKCFVFSAMQWWHRRTKQFNPFKKNIYIGCKLFVKTINIVIRFVSASAKFGTCTAVSVNGTLVEDKFVNPRGECTHFIFNKCPIYTHEGASVKFSTNSHETDYKAARILIDWHVWNKYSLSFFSYADSPSHLQ